jgi:uncharacterized protein with PQ loop repeat
MFATSLPTIIGLIAGCLSSWSLVPQLLKCWREGLTEAVSKKMFATAPLASSSGASMAISQAAFRS